MDRKKSTTGGGSAGSVFQETSPEGFSIVPTINHALIRTLAQSEQGLGLYDLSNQTALSANVVRNHVFTLIVAGIVSFEEGSLYLLTDAGKKLLEDILT